MSDLFTGDNRVQWKYRVRSHGRWVIEMWFRNGQPYAVRRTFVIARILKETK